MRFPFDSKLFRKHVRRLNVPDKFNRNSHTVTSVWTPEQSGCLLLERMRRRIGFDSYADKKVLDFGCAVRFSQAIINTPVEIGRYVGVDIDEEMIQFLRRTVRDPRFEYIFIPAYHPLYNPKGIKLSAHLTLPIDNFDFDVVCMFSVITHQYADDSKSIFSILRRYVAADGHLFFTCFLDHSISNFEDRSEQRNGGRCFYNPAFLTDLVASCGWRLIDQAPGEGPIIGDSFLFAPH